MPKRRLLSKKIRCQPDIWDFLNDEYLPGDWTFPVFDLHDLPAERAKLWKEYGPEILETWIEKRPGSRPSFWWEFQSPEPRKQLSGQATEYSGPPDRGHFFRGIPGYFQAIDEDNPPVYESEACFLKRHGLFYPGEEKRLGRDAFKPESVFTILEEKERIKPY